jgi:hypothetical protein
MVGDSPSISSNGSVQFPMFSFQDNSYFGVVEHPDGNHLLFKTEPVTFEGFVPAVLNSDVGAVVLGQNVTVAGYGADRLQDDAFSSPGLASESSLRVAAVSETSFTLDGTGQVGPCQGE